MLSVFVNMILVLFVIIIAVSSIKIIKQATVGVVERLGKYHKTAEQGINVIIPFIDRFRYIIDMREQVVDFPPQPVITKDNVTMMIDTVVYYQVTDPFKFSYEISNAIVAIENLTATTLRNIVGDLELDETLTSRDLVNTKLRAILDEATDKWGIKVNRVELKNILPPQDIQNAMEKQMRAEREKREAILRAEGQKTAAILEAEGLKQAAILNAEAVRKLSGRRRPPSSPDFRGRGELRPFSRFKSFCGQPGHDQRRPSRQQGPGLKIFGSHQGFGGRSGYQTDHSERLGRSAGVFAS